MIVENDGCIKIKIKIKKPKPNVFCYSGNGMVYSNEYFFLIWNFRNAYYSGNGMVCSNS